MPASRRAVPILILVASIWLVFWPATHGQFVGWDDSEMVQGNPGLNPPSWKAVGQFWERPVEFLYTPLTYTLWAGVASLTHPPLDPLPFHLLNLLLHTAGAVLVFLLLCELIEPMWAAWAGAMVFALHPVQVEPVAWVAGMNNLLFGALTIAALWQYVRFARYGGQWRFLIATVLYGGALLSKPAAVVAPLLAWAIDQWMLKRAPRRSAPLLVWAGMALPIALVARMSQPAEVAWGLVGIDRMLAAVDAIGFYTFKIIAPIHLYMDYERTPRWVVDHPQVAWRGGVALVAAIIIWWKGSDWMRASMAIAIAALLPVLGLVWFDFQSYSTVADRYMYLPMVGVALAVAAVVRRCGGAGIVAAVVVMMALAGRSWAQAAVWHDTQSLAEHELAFDKDSSTGHKILAEWLSGQGRDAEAETEFKAAIAALHLEQKPGNGAVQFDYGNLLMRENRLIEAIIEYQAAIRLLTDEQKPKAMNNLGVAYLKRGDAKDARTQFNKALQLQPGYAEARRNLDRLNAMSGG